MAAVGGAAGLRNVQTLQSLHSVSPSPSAWEAPAAEVLALHRELVRLEWRDNALGPRVARDSPYQIEPFGVLEREQALPDIRQACDNARRVSGPAYSSSYFWPMTGGRGMELMELCLPVVRAGQPVGFLVATYSLPGLLTLLCRARRVPSASVKARPRLRNRSGLGSSDSSPGRE